MPRALVRLASAAVVALACGPREARLGELSLSLRDAASGRPLAARLELLDEAGRPVTPSGALAIRRPECFDAALPGWLRRERPAESIDDPYRGSRQFYVDGELATRLPAGRYRLRASRGTEYRVAELALELRAGERTRRSLALERWIDLPAQGWWGADDHLHIARAGPEDNAALARWMAAEGLHVANLLQGGTAEAFDITPQFAFGAAGAHREGTTLLLSGQEQPRTHLLGHTLILGGSAPIDLRDPYLVYRHAFAEAARQGALAGYAHWGLGAGAFGVAVDAPSGLLSFVEVLDFDYAAYETWYDLLNLGLRIAPTAGTDYPCNPRTLPGRDRFYTRVEGPLTPESWLAGVRAGRTFVTNGPALELEVEGRGIGDELRLPGPGRVEVRGRVRFDPQRDDVGALELVQAGRVIALGESAAEAGRIELRHAVEVRASTWLALRARGRKRGETPPPRRSPSTRLVAWLLPRLQGGAPFAERFMREERHWPSAAHTAAVFVTLAGSPPLAEQPLAREIARRWRQRLAGLRARLAPERLDEQVIWSVPTGDGVPLERLRRERDALVRAIDHSMAFYAERAE